MSVSLSLDVFNSGYKPIPGGPGWPENEQATWPASTSTLIASDTDAILVDALLTTAEGERLQVAGLGVHTLSVGRSDESGRGWLPLCNPSLGGRHR
jgi:hypothetical protein